MRWSFGVASDGLFGSRAVWRGQCLRVNTRTLPWHVGERYRHGRISPDPNRNRTPHESRLLFPALISGMLVAW